MGNYKIAGIISEREGLFKQAIKNYEISGNCLDKIMNIKKRILNVNNNQKEILENTNYLDTPTILAHYKEKGIKFTEGIMNEISN